MPQIKFAYLAGLLELSAWSGPFFLGSRSDAALAAYLLIHLLASVALAFYAAILLPNDGMQQRRPRFFLIAAVSYTLPVLGFIGVCLAVIWLRHYRSHVAPHDFEAVRLPAFDPHQRPQAAFRQAGLRSFLGNPQVPAEARVGAMVALQYVSGRVSTPLLRDVLSDPSEDIRLLAYGMLDNQEKRINRAIDEELKALANPAHGERGGWKLPSDCPTFTGSWCIRSWRRVTCAITPSAESRRYCEIVLASDPDNAPLRLRQGRLRHEAGDIEGAGIAYQQAIELGLPATRVLPYQAELSFERRDFPATARLMNELANWASLPRLRPVIDYWTYNR
jgi:polysaccharide biosynthesis protein PelE